MVRHCDDLPTNEPRSTIGPAGLDSLESFSGRPVRAGNVVTSGLDRRGRRGQTSPGEEHYDYDNPLR